MRLKKLTMQAFGPFKNKVVIDFEENNINKGLLLISGDTGAGKTTIFDGVSYALFGETSGDTREGNSLRSDYASIDDETYVELEFYNKGTLYTVKRSPEYIRKAKRGEGTTKENASAEVEINGRKITKVNDVTKEIEELLGLNYKQFRQVAMLSQGEFTRFLLAKSEEKTDIFRKIFNTDLYLNIQNRLIYDKKTIEDKIEKVKYKLDNEKENIKPIIDVFGLNNNEVLDTLENRLKEDIANLNVIKEKRDKSNEEQNKIKNTINEINTINKKIVLLDNNRKELNQLLIDNKTIDEDKLIYEYNINVANTIKSLLDLKYKDELSLKSNKEKIEVYNKELETYNKEYNSKKELFNELDNYTNKVNSITKDINSVKELIKGYEDYKDLNTKLDKKKKELIEATGKYDKEYLEYETLRKKYYLNISVEIASALNEGEECPVCGSIDHPHLASNNQTDISKEDIERKESEVKNLDSNRKQIESIIDVLNDNIKILNIEDKDVDKELDNLNKKLIELNELLLSANKTYNNLSKDKERLTNNISSINSSIKTINDLIDTLTKNITNYETKLNNTYKDNNTDYEEYLVKVRDNNEINILSKKINEYNTKKSNLEGVINTLEVEVKDKKITSVEKLTEEYELKNKEYIELDNIYNTNSTVVNTLTKSINNIKTFIDEYLSIEEDYKTIKLLSDVANGNLSGKIRLSFESYVQGYYLNYVLVEANKRLSKMTDGRYELKKKENETSLRGKVGLDFVVMDAYTGKIREVTSLSGGEKFKASLALALGLSDVISMHAGGIKIDSLFIDEGFGSLDSESLNQAIGVLDELSNNDKLVGVISHVGELKSVIDNKIIVKKNTTGSSILIEANS